VVVIRGVRSPPAASQGCTHHRHHRPQHFKTVNSNCSAGLCSNFKYSVKPAHNIYSGREAQILSSDWLTDLLLPELQREPERGDVKLH